LSIACETVEFPHGATPSKKNRQAWPFTGPISLNEWEELRSEVGFAWLFAIIPRLPVEEQPATNNIATNEIIVVFMIILLLQYLMASKVFFINPRLNRALLNKVSGLSNENKCTQDFDNSEENESSTEPDPIL
jgi:hypothetical protein